MSKQTQANAILATSVGIGLDRQTIIDEIAAQTDSGPAYAATLYRNANKAFAVVETPAADGSMTKFTNPNLDKLRDEIDAALDAVAANHGITLKIGNIRYDTDRMSFTTKIEANVGSAEDKSRKDWNLYCSAYGFKASDFGRTFTTPKGKTYKIAGINPKARVRPITAHSVPGGSEFGFTADVLKLLK